MSGSERPCRKLLTEPAKSNRAKRKPKIAQGHVEIPGNKEEIGDDGVQPYRHNVCADSWTRGDEHGGCHFDEPDDEHERVPRERKQPLDHGSKILIPVGQKMVELIEPARKGAAMNTR